MCFSLIWFRDLFVLLVIVCAIYSILKIVIPYLLSKLEAPVGEGAGIVVRCFNVFLWAIIAIFVIYIVFALISCLWSYVGGFPLMPTGRR